MNVFEYAADDDAVADWAEFCGIQDQAVSGDMTAYESGWLEGRAMDAIKADSALMGEAVACVSDWDMPVRGQSEDDILGTIFDGYAGGVVQFYLDKRGASSVITR